MEEKTGVCPGCEGSQEQEPDRREFLRSVSATAAAAASLPRNPATQVSVRRDQMGFFESSGGSR